LSAYRFHAAPPPGTWFNDPNGLVKAGGEWRLFVQYAADAPDFRATGWARLSSADLIDWRFDGAVLPQEQGIRRYSGSVLGDGARLRAWLTLHDGAPEAAPRQRQIAADSDDAGRTWRWAEADDLPRGANVRDPFVWRDGDALAALVAHPCDWGAVDGRSHLTLHRMREGRFVQRGRIGQWSPPLVMWEVPALIDLGQTQMLIVSLVDRRGGGASCSVRYWPGTLREDGFDPAPGTPGEGWPLDLGPDHYAAIPAAGAPVTIAWASNWAEARQRATADGGQGGVLTMPRRHRLHGQWLAQEPLPQFVRFVRWSSVLPERARYRLHWRGGEATLEVGDKNICFVMDGHRASHPLVDRSCGIALYQDADLIELFVGGSVVTFVATGEVTISEL
jgi:sucrose-6-phosphate hydrolase SacC (GH32 family)